MCGVLLAHRESRFSEYFERIRYRGPDNSSHLEVGDWTLGFHRLAIMDPSEQGNQPMLHKSYAIACNGEIYNHRKIRTLLGARFRPNSNSDCEVIAPLIDTYGMTQAVALLDGEFAFVGVDTQTNQAFAARDHLGVRPLFFGFHAGRIVFASEMKVLTPLCAHVHPFPPGHSYQNGKFEAFPNSKTRTPARTRQEATKGIRERLTLAVQNRLQADRPLGALLSGGLDSSLVCSIATKGLEQPLTTFAVGLDQGAIDIPYAAQVAKFIGSDHHEVLFSTSDVLNSIENLIYRLETFDVTTIRASIGMDQVCRYVRDNTDIRVLLTGEVSDELFGYKYTDFAPSPQAFQEEACKRVRELYMYDILRADRCISSNSIEARVPFSDRTFVEFVMDIAPEWKLNTTGHGKALLREAFVGTGVLPDHILWREKAAFSDAQGHGVVDFIKNHVESIYTDSDLSRARSSYTHCPPQTKEALWYREIFESFFTGHAHVIKDYWMPNQSWRNCNVTDPSARVLPNYGQSGV